MKKILNILQDNKALHALLDYKKDIVVNTISDEALLVASAFLSSKRNIVIIKANQYEANSLYRELSKLCDDVYLFSSDESYRIEALAASLEIQSMRVNCLYALTNDKPKIVIGHTHSLIRYVPTKSLFKESCITLKSGDIINLHDFQKKLVEIGYHQTSRVDMPMYFSRRGGVIDVFSPQYDNPIRIEFFDDEVDFIKFYNPQSQRTLDKIEQATIIPATDILYQDSDVNLVATKIKDLFEENASSLDDAYYEELDNKISMDIENLIQHDNDSSMYAYYGLFNEVTTFYNYIDNPITIVSNEEEVKFNYSNFVSENFFYYEELFSVGKFLKGLKLYYELDEVLDNYICFKNFGDSKDVVFETHQLNFNRDKENIVIKQILEYLKYSKVLICLKDNHQLKLICDLLDNHSVKYYPIGLQDELQKGVNIYLGNLNTAVELVNEKVTVITSSELFGNVQVSKGKYIRYKGARVIKDYQELNIGDYVVHDAHGIGQYLGIKTLDVKGNHKDYLYVTYANNDTLYIPVEQFKLIRKYSSVDGRPPKIHKLGSSQWTKAKQKAKEKIDDIAASLIEIYSKRMASVGFAFKPDDELQLEFESKFEYELTPDQQRSIDEIKEDMEKQQPMDRLLCGDVGFGKTEVALRAAFKAILSNKQVAFLCPTTILSMQHYKTVMERFEGFPVTIALLNRFTTTSKKKEILNGLKNGTIDIVIGTHRILSKDVVIKDIGLLVIDEEQRFGVRQKERIKELRESIDVLSLSATPIPRTLQMSLMGIRGLSQIETPPKDRMPVQTYVIEKNNTLIKQVIERELARDGQVFYLYNRTETIHNAAYSIASMIPEARVAVGHGKMDKDELEDVMVRFMNKEFNVLVCTTIIETGIDIPNANTIIIEDADRFGLSQLYQIRGRVGRSTRTSYAYMLYRNNLNDVATKRLKAIKEFTELGSGYKIALRDLSIRGAGDILGGKQAGFIDSVGFDMYMKILQDAINERKNVKISEEKEPIENVNVNVDGYIPENYVSSDYEKLELYQRLETATSLQEVTELNEEFNDFYGKLPEEVERLLEKRRLDIIASNPMIESVEDKDKSLQITFTKEASSNIPGDKLFEEATRLFTKPSFKALNQKIMISINKNDNWLKNLNALLIKFTKG